VRNALADRDPSVIMRAANAIDVANAVRFARENDLLLAVRSGGHSFAGNSVAGGAVVVDLSKMKGMSIDPSVNSPGFSPA
jgi:FAD/FMN-containing dehydrogenase